MADKDAADDQVIDESPGASEAFADDEDDAEGHMLMPNIASARLISEGRTRDVERNTRGRVQQKDGRPNEKRGR